MLSSKYTIDDRTYYVYYSEARLCNGDIAYHKHTNVYKKRVSNKLAMKKDKKNIVDSIRKHLIKNMTYEEVIQLRDNLCILNTDSKEDDFATVRLSL